MKEDYNNKYKKWTQNRVKEKRVYVKKKKKSLYNTLNTGYEK